MCVDAKKIEVLAGPVCGLADLRAADAASQPTRKARLHLHTSILFFASIVEGILDLLAAVERRDENEQGAPSDD